MSERLPIVDNLCRNPENHKMHMCELKLAGKAAEIKKFSKDPEYICNNCAATANTEGALCAPGPLDG